MRSKLLMTAIVIGLVLKFFMPHNVQAAELNPPLADYVSARIAEFDQIDEDRQQVLRQLASYIQSQVDAGQPVRLTFICTHNSRRSHLSQLWGAVAAARYGVADVLTFSGGTESTAFNPRAVAAIERAGLLVEKGPEVNNPHYQVRYAADSPASECFSKVFNQSPNPQADFCAVMTCTQADKNCPVVKGAAVRIALPYEDPKVADGTPQEAATYDERCRQIACELLFAFSQVRTGK